MPALLISESKRKDESIPILLLNREQFKKWLSTQEKPIRRWVEQSRFEGEQATFCLIPSPKGAMEKVLVGAGEQPDMWSLASLPNTIPQGVYHLEGKFTPADQEKMALGWLLATYQFSRYRKKNGRKYPTLRLSSSVNIKLVALQAECIFWARDLINTPTNDMGPSALAGEAADMARQYKAQCKIIVGQDLLKENYPVIHAVGRAAEDKPRLIDIRWGKKNHPKVTLIGKGVCFDSGGLDIKSSGNMKLMKKDMGGAAVVLALARLIMESRLPVRLRVMIPAVENSISGNAFRPLDILPSRSGKNVEIGNTDAEGRLILCDAIWDAAGEKPAMLIDCATLTGAARVALGTDIPAFFTPDDTLAAELYKHSRQQQDPLWRLPLWEPYREMLSSPVADINNAPDSGYAGAITAALFLKEFTRGLAEWIHIDMMAWNVNARPGRPAGGEAMALRALFSMLQQKFTYR